jgi:hypothetical protein
MRGAIPSGMVGRQRPVSVVVQLPGINVVYVWGAHLTYDRGHNTDESYVGQGSLSATRQR